MFHIVINCDFYNIKVHIIDFTAEDDESESMHLSHPNTTEVTQKPKMKKLFRVAYLGLPESCDEWIDTYTQCMIYLFNLITIYIHDVL